MNKKREILGACWKVVVEMKKTKDKFERKIRREIKKMKYGKWKDIFNNGWLGSHIEEEHGKMWKELWIAERKWKFARTRMYLNAYCIINWEYF